MDTAVERTRETPGTGAAAGLTRGPWKVLLVESSREEAAQFNLVLAEAEGSPFALEWAESLGAALKRLATGAVDLVLLDLRVTDNPGLPGLVQLKASFQNQAVVVLLDRDHEAQEREALSEGALACVRKDKLEPYWLAHILRGAHARQGAEEKVRASLAFYRSVVEQLPHGIFRKDLQGRFTYANPSFSELAGVPQHEVVGRTSLDLFPPELAKRYAEQDQEVLRTGQPLGRVESFQTPDGRQLHLHISKTPIRNRQGRIVALQGLFMDVTERAKVEEEVRASQHTLQAILDNSAAVLYVKDPQGRYLLINRQFEKLFHWTRDQIIGKTDYDLFPREVAEVFRANDQQVLATRAPIECEESAPYDHGTRNYISVKFPLCAASGEPYAVCGISTDITERKQTEEALERERYLLDTLISNLPDTVYFKDTASRFIRVNQALAERLGGTDPAHMLGKTDFDFFAREHAEPAFHDEQEVMKTGQPIVSKEEKEVWPDGREKWVSTTKMPLRDRAGQVIGTFGVSRDITERKKAEQRLFAHYAITRALAESISLREAAPKILQAVCESLGWDFGELWLLDRRGEVLRCFGLWHAPAPALKEFASSSYELTFASGVGIPGRVWATGQPAWIADLAQDDNLPRAVLCQRAGLRDAFGFPVHVGKEFLGVITFFSRDLRQPEDDLLQLFAAIGSQVGQFIVRRRAEEARSRLSAIVEFSEDAIFSEDLEGRITSWNPGAKKMFGYLPGEIVSEMSSVLAPPDRADEMTQIREKIKQLAPVDHFETVRVTKADKHLPVSLTLSPIKDPRGRVVGVSSIARNVSERKKAEEKLRAFAANLAQSNRDLEDFAFVASHDLQEPLGKVQAFADLLLAEAGSTLSEKGQDYLRRLHKATGRMQTLIRGLLTFSRVQTEAAPFETVDLNLVMQEVLADLESRIRETGARVETTPLGSLDGDQAQLRQVLQNLIGNALKFTRPGQAPVVKVHTQRVLERLAGTGPPQEVCRLSVEDNGIGIEEKYVGRLFNMFQRLRPQEYEGTGIGLATCRRIVQRHSGAIRVQSQPGQGSTFTVTLPVRQRRGDTSL